MDLHERQVESERDRELIWAMALGGALCLVLSLAWVLSCVLPQRFETVSPVDNRINPNTASAASLMRLPGVGAGRAEAIVAFRRTHQARDPNAAAFRDANDLLQIRGIGPKTLADIEPSLRFDAPGPNYGGLNRHD